MWHTIVTILWTVFSLYILFGIIYARMNFKDLKDMSFEDTSTKTRNVIFLICLLIAYTVSWGILAYLTLRAIDRHRDTLSRIHEKLYLDGDTEGANALGRILGFWI